MKTQRSETAVEESRSSSRHGQYAAVGGKLSKRRNGPKSALRLLIVIPSIVFVLALASSINAKAIYVDRNSTATAQDGSRLAPFKTVTAALDLARKTRFGYPPEGIQPSGVTIDVYVESGEYVGSFDPQVLALDPSLETLPLLLNVPELKLRGSTRFRNGVVISGTQTIIRPSTRQASKQHMVVVTRTLPIAGSGYPESTEMVGDDVLITGFIFEGLATDGTQPTPVNSQGSALIAIDGVDDFIVRENVITRAGTFGISTRLSSGRIEDNFVLENQGVGLNITGGSQRFPAQIEIERNLVKNNVNGGMGLNGAAQTENDHASLFAAHKFRRVPLPQFYDRTAHPEEVPDRLEAFVGRNEVSGSNIFGIRCDGYIRDQYQLSDSSDMTASVTATLRYNVVRSIVNYGLVVDAAQIPADARKHRISLDVTLISNTLESNGSGPALFSFWRLASAVSATAAGDGTLTFAQDSTIDICGDVGPFHFENRAADPNHGTPTNNSLTVGEVMLTGSCIPLNSCIPQDLGAAARCQ